MSESAGVSRRRVLGGCAALGACAPVLAACGGDGDGGGGGGGGDTAAAGTVLATVSDVPVGGGIILEGDGVVLTQPAAGTIKAFSARCTHQGCVVDSVSTSINCTCHGSRFSVTDGSVEKGPATSALAEVPITVEGGEIKAG